MRRRKLRFTRIATVFSMLLIAGTVMIGCSEMVRYKTLTFFFTGVPSPEEKAAREKEAGEAGKPAVSVKVARKRKQLAFLQKARFFVHGPFGSGQCERCHATTASKPFRTGKDKVADTAVKRSVNIGPRLAFPLEKLCVTCHSEKSNDVAASKGLWQHGPVAKGWCVTCHSPHKSARQYMLLKNDTIELCTSCHHKNDLLLTTAHREVPAADCLVCHNPHLGKTAFLLKSEYDEWQEF